MKNDELIQVGSFGPPQGLKGYIKINIFTFDLNSFKNLKEYYLDDFKSKIIFKSIKKIGKKYVASLKGCDNRNVALDYKGKNIFVLKENFPETKKNEFYIFDLIGCKIVNLKGKLIGKVKDIKNFGAGDLIEMANKDNFFSYIPMNDENLIEVDINNKKIKVDPILGILE